MAGSHFTARQPCEDAGWGAYAPQSGWSSEGHKVAEESYREPHGDAEDRGEDLLTATFRTTAGTFVVRLFSEYAPGTARNFVELARGDRQWTNPQTGQLTSDRLYDGTVFHRVIAGFMIQGGDPLGSGSGGPGYRFPDEIHPDLAFIRPYLLAMANAGPGTNGSQFFVTVAPAEWLTGRHTIFGDVIDGHDVVDAISKVETDGQDRPVTDVVLESVTIGQRPRTNERPRTFGEA